MSCLRKLGGVFCHKYLEAISKMPISPISASGLNRNPQNIYIYSSGYDPAPSLTSNYFSIFEIASIKDGGGGIT
jgi:hypothetical protein